MKYINKLFLSLFLIQCSFAELNPVQGQNYMFWVYGQGFFSGYYQTSATLDTLGEKTLIYTEDALVRDVKVNPYNSSTWVATTNSGVFISYNSGETWAPFNGDEDDRLPAEEESNLLNISEVAPQHIEQIHSIAFEDEDTWWVGVKETEGVFRSTNAAETWKKKNTGLPTFNGRSPSAYQVYFAEGDDNVYAATEGGCFYRDGSRFKDRNAGFPEPSTTDWPGIPCYEIAVDGNIIYAATEHGLFAGSVENNFNDKLPINGTISTIISSEITPIFTEIQDSILNGTFSIDWTSGDSIFYYDYFLVQDSIGEKLTLTIENENAEVGQNVNVHDTEFDLMWTGTVYLDENSGDYKVLLSEENIYYFNEDVLDIEEEELNIQNLNFENMVVYNVNSTKITDMKLFDNIIFYSTDEGLFQLETGSNEIIHLGFENLTINDIEGFPFISTIGGIDVFGLELVIATSKGIKKLIDGEWTEITPQIATLNTSNSYSYVVTSLELVGDSTIIAGCGTIPYEDDRTQLFKTGGILISNDAGQTWESKNLGLTHRSVLRSSVNELLVSSEESTNLDSTKGIFNVLTDLYGYPTDIDWDDRVNVLIVDMDDNAYNSTSDLVVQGYFNPEDQNIESDFSNNLDILYIDSDPQNVSDSQEGLARAYSRMIAYNYDSEELEWVISGIEQFGAYFSGYRTMPEDSTITVENNNGLKYGDFGRRKENNQLFTLFYYLNEQIFNSFIGISAVVQDTLTGVEGLSSAIKFTNPELTFDTVFENWGIALHFDNPDINVFNGIYGFKEINTSIAPATYPWGVSSGQAPYIESIKNWSVKYVQSEKWVEGSSGWTDKSPDFNGETLVMNGTDNSDISIVIIQQPNKIIKDNTSQIEFMDLSEDKNRGVYTNWSEFGSTVEEVTDSSQLNNFNYFAAAIFCKDAGAESGGSFSVDDETISPGELKMNINQHPDLSHFLDIFAYSDVEVYSDGALSYGGNTGPQVDIYGANLETILTTISIPEFYSNIGNAYQYSFDLRSFLPTTEFEFKFIANSESIGGNPTNSDTTTVFAIQNSELEKSINEYISSQEGIKIIIPNNQNSTGGFNTFIVQNDITIDGLSIIGNSYLYKHSQINADFQVQILFDKSHQRFNTTKNLDIILINDNTYEIITNVEISDEFYIGAKLNKSGIIAVFESDFINSNIPNEFFISENYPNPFNPTTNFNVNIPHDGTLNLSIYDLKGQKIKTINNSEVQYGINSFSWDSLNEQGINVPSGVYFLVGRLNNQVYSRKLLLMK